LSHTNRDNGKDFYTIDYSAFGVLAIKAIQEQQQIIEKLKADIEELKKEKASSAISTPAVNNAGKSAAALSAAHLNQNAPNPFNAATVINYYLPEIKGIASIEIISSNGQLMKTYPITKKGKGQLSIP
jgi:hypothetical protein